MNDHHSEQSNQSMPLDPSPHALGAFPLELWWSIMEIVDDAKSLLSCACTCKPLNNVAKRIIAGRRQMDILSSLSREYEQEPTHGYFLTRLHLRCADIPTWVVIHSATSPHLAELNIWGAQYDRFMRLHSRIRLAVSLLTSLTSLILFEVHFFSFSTFARTICAFPNLERLVLQDVRVHGSDGGNVGLLKAFPFARTLRLQYLNVSYDDTVCPSLWGLMSAPCLSETFRELHIEPTSEYHALRDPSFLPDRSLFTDLHQLRRLEFTYTLGKQVPNPIDPVASVLARLPDRVAVVAVSCSCQYREDPYLDEWARLFRVLEDTLLSSAFPFLRQISVTLKALRPADVDYLSTAQSSFLSSTNLKGTLVARFLYPRFLDDVHYIMRPIHDKPPIPPIVNSELGLVRSPGVKDEVVVAINMSYLIPWQCL